MINFVDEEGNRIDPPNSTGEQIGRAISRVAYTYGVGNVIPFSSLHKYQRADSVWARQYASRLEDYKTGFESDHCELLPAYTRYDCLTDTVHEINPSETPDDVVDPIQVGDDWSERLEKKEIEAVNTYFQAIQPLGKVMG